MKKIENKKIVIIAIIAVVIVVGVVKILDNFFEKNTKDTGILNMIQTDSQNEEIDKIIIYITGEIVNEGVYELDEGSRISNAIEKAGGVKETANLRDVNLAYELSDGEKIYIPNKDEEEIEIVSYGSGESVGKEKNGIININKADSNELQELTGIGESTAQSIIKYREENGNFKTIEELMNVQGIGESKFENIKDKIKVK